MGSFDGTLLLGNIIAESMARVILVFGALGIQKFNREAGNKFFSYIDKA